MDQASKIRTVSKIRLTITTLKFKIRTLVDMDSSPLCFKERILVVVAEDRKEITILTMLLMVDRIQHLIGEV